MAERTLQRLTWAMDVMRIQPADRVLEVGSGHGAAATLVCAQLGSGRLLGLDRSAKMTGTANRRNQESIAAGIAEFRTTTLAAAALERSSFDVIFAFNVSLFWTRPARELTVVADALAPDGRLYVFHQPPNPEKNRQVVDAATELLTGAGWIVHDTVVGNTPPVESVCLIAGR